MSSFVHTLKIGDDEVTVEDAYNLIDNFNSSPKEKKLAESICKAISKGSPPLFKPIKKELINKLNKPGLA